jgi:hypothetical protein
MKSMRKIGVLFGYTACCIIALALAAGTSSFANADGPWNSHAIQGTFAGVRVIEIDPSRSEVVFLYDLDNKTDGDFQLTKGPTVVIMSRLKSSGSLSSEKQVSLNSSAFIPARNRTRIEVSITLPFSWPVQMDNISKMRIRQLVASETADLGGFVLFDQGSRYQIELPGAWPEIEKAP